MVFVRLKPRALALSYPELVWVLGFTTVGGKAVLDIHYVHVTHT